MNIRTRIELIVCAAVTAVAALLVSPLAVAQDGANTGPVPLTAGPIPAPLPDCRPELFGGVGVRMSVGTSTDGTLVVLWACPGAMPGQWRINGFHWSSNYIPKLPSASAILRSGDLFDEMWKANVLTNLPVTQAVADSWEALKAQTLSKLPQWMVAPNGTSTTRPVYSYTQRTLADQSTQIGLDATTVRATVGKPCDCAALRYAPGATTYCQIPPAALSATTVPKPVAVCRLQ